MAIGFLYFIVASFVAFRFALLYPATAIENREITVRTSWRFTTGNTFRFYFGALLSLGPFALAAQLVSKGKQQLLVTSEGFALVIGVELISWMLSFAQIAVAAAYLSHAYKFFVEERNLRLPVTGPSD